MAYMFIQKMKNTMFMIQSVKRFLLGGCLSMCFLGGALAGGKEDFVLLRGRDAAVFCGKGEDLVVRTAVGLLSDDFNEVFDASLKNTSQSKADIVVGTVTDRGFRRWVEARGIDVSGLAGRHEGYLLRVIGSGKHPQLVIAGSDKRGTAYGVMTLSRMIGVSPWSWWADCRPEKKETFELEAGYELSEAPSVAYRGIFLNDEDWGLTPWSSTNYEPKMRAAAGGDAGPRKGEIGPYTHDRIFELLLRLKANTFWPAMHECSVPFYFVDGNQEKAEKYGILVSTSHCEPMMRNTNGEWKKAGAGEYNFITNRDNVVKFWEERVAQLAGSSDCIYTLGMRGVHDSKMLGAKTVSEQVAALTEIIRVQRDMLARHIHPDVTQVPQQFVPYKEVLDCYRAGLEVPEDVALIWCDDNYGYIRHFPTPGEQARKGGNGMYYHISYWGRPHDYLWLATTPPELIREEMLKAYDHGVNRIWVVNVGDIKPGEYLTSLFLEMAWDIDRFRSEDALDSYLAGWYGEQLGVDGTALLPLWKNYYDLSFACRPEFLGGVRTEEKDPRYKQVNDVPLNADEIIDRLVKSREIDYKVTAMAAAVPAGKRDAWFQLVEYPLRSMAAMNEKCLGAQLARHGLGGWAMPHAAYDTIIGLTRRYNALGDGKWRGIMDCAPRKLADFNPVKEEKYDTAMPQGMTGTVAFASPVNVGTPVAVGEPFSCDIPSSPDSIRVEVHVLPVHPINEKSLRYRISIDGEDSVIMDVHTEGRSEEWKRNVLYNRAVRTVTFPAPRNRARHRLLIEPVDETIYLQRVIFK